MSEDEEFPPSNNKSAHGKEEPAGDKLEAQKEREEKEIETDSEFLKRYKELVDEGLSRKEIAQTLYDEGFLPKDIMKMHLPLRGLKKKEDEPAKVPSPRSMTDEAIQASIAQPSGKGEGYIDDLKRMIKYQVARSRELTESFYSFGLASMLAALAKSGISIEDFRKLAKTSKEPSSIMEALNKAGETIFKALEAYNADIIPKIEAERDEARFYASKLELQLEEINKKLEPRQSLENMIYKLAMLGGTNMNPAIITDLIDKWLQMQMPTIIEGV